MREATRHSLVFIFWLAAFGGVAHAGPAPPWPQGGSDLRPDPAITFGALDNGMRYEVQKNAYPPGRISLRFRINVGSRIERSDERGIAHFLEHMAFRGSAHYPDGSVMKRLAALGLRAGADANANTSETQTVFRIDLPNNNPEALQAALTFFRDIADGLTLDPQALDSERKVVLSEARLADTPSRRAGERLNRFVLASLHKTFHPPIGDVDLINSMNAVQLADFYHAYYRPANATLVVVGDLDPQELIAKVGAQFGDWRATGDEPRKVVDDTPSAAAPRVHVDTEWAVGNYVAMFWTRPDDEPPDSQAREREDLVTQVAFGVLDRRYDVVAQRKHPPFFSSAANQSRRAHIGETAAITVSYEEGQWPNALMHMDAIRRGTLDDAIAQKEVDAVASRILARYRTSAETTENHVTALIAEVLVRDLDEDRVSQTSADQFERARIVLTGIKPDTVKQILKAAFAGQEPLVWLRSVTVVPGGDVTLQQALSAAQVAPSERVKVPIATQWPYKSFGRAGRVTNRQTIADLDATTVQYANGVRLNIKQTRFTPDQIGVTVSIGNGVRDLPMDGPPIDWAINNVFIRAGLEKIDYDAMQIFLSDKRYGVSFLATGEAFSLSGTTRPSDLDTQLQVLAAYCTAPAFREGVFEQSKNGYVDVMRRWPSEPYRLLTMELGGLLRSNDPRYVQPTVEGMRSVRVKDLKAVVDPQLARAYMEITMVGDVNIDEAIEAVGKTFGALKPRQPTTIQPVAEGPFPAATPSPVVRPHEGGDTQGAAAIAWPAAEMLADGKQFYALTMLAAVLNSRLSDRLRTELGTSYAGQVAYVPSEVGPESRSVFEAFADISPSQETLFFEGVANIVADLKAAPISQEELDRAQKPRIANLSTSMSLNGFWMHWLNLSQRDPRRLEFARNAMTYLKSVTPADVQQAAGEFLKEEAAWRVVYHKAAMP
jgi:zinc protease